MLQAKSETRVQPAEKLGISRRTNMTEKVPSVIDKSRNGRREINEKSEAKTENNSQQEAVKKSVEIPDSKSKVDVNHETKTEEDSPAKTKKKIKLRECSYCKNICVVYPCSCFAESGVAYCGVVCQRKDWEAHSESEYHQDYDDDE